MSSSSNPTSIERSVILTRVMSQVRGVAFNQLQREDVMPGDRAGSAVDLVAAWDQCAGSLARTGSVIQDQQRQGALIHLAATAIRILVAIQLTPKAVDQKHEEPNTDLFNEQA